MATVEVGATVLVVVVASGVAGKRMGEPGPDGRTNPIATIPTARKDNRVAGASQRHDHLGSRGFVVGVCVVVWSA
jgi:hypothetical protein